MDDLRVSLKHSSFPKQVSFDVEISQFGVVLLLWILKDIKMFSCIVIVLRHNLYYPSCAVFK